MPDPEGVGGVKTQTCSWGRGLGGVGLRLQRFSPLKKNKGLL